MDCTASRIPYRQVNSFSKITLDYIDQSESLKQFYAFPPNVKGIQQAIERRRKFPNDRELLVNVLKDQYSNVEHTENVQQNICSLLLENSFAVTTAHQNNIFTGPLYFIYKIVHVIRLAQHFKQMLPEHHFVPVFYVGSEDADLAELNHIYLANEKLEWETKQTGAVGRMEVDKNLLKLIDRMEGELSVLPHGREFIELIRKYYVKGKKIQDVTFHFVNHLFGEYGLVILLPDNARLKRKMSAIFKDDLVNQTASHLLDETTGALNLAGYKTQANARQINLFYLDRAKRERIEKIDEEWRLVNGIERFTENDLEHELENHPEKFSPNVILRGLFQETILPNIAFVGGGGETAYWLQLKKLFENYKVPFPVLILRNSFLVVEKKWREAIAALGFDVEDFFSKEQELINKWVQRQTKVNIKLEAPLQEVQKLYDSLKNQVAAVDTTLEKHVEALKAGTVYSLQELEKKMLRAEKRKYADQQQQLQKIKSRLFPKDGLQERFENISYYYSVFGPDFIKRLYENSPAMEQEFTILSC